MDRSFFLALGLLAGCAATACAQHASFEKDVQPFLERHCIECHAGDKPKGKLRLDLLKTEFSDAASAKGWNRAIEKLSTGEMPPKGQPRPDLKEMRAFGRWVDQNAHSLRQQQGRVVLRRLNRIEYENTVRDLLAINADLRELLPVDAAANGFDNVGEALHVSSFLMERYLEAADVALNMAIVNTPQPPLHKKRYLLSDERQVKEMSEPVYLKREGHTVLFSASPWSAVNLWQFYPADRGTYRVRISAFGTQSDKPITFRVDAGPMLMGTKNHLVGYFDVPPDKATTIEFTDHLEARNHIRISPYNLGTAFDVTKAGGAEKYTGPGLAIEYVDIEGPIHDIWPPESHRRVFGELPQRRIGNKLEVYTDDDDAAEAKTILRRFAAKAFRRPVNDTDIQPFVELFEERRADESSFEQAMRVAIKGVLVSPHFLFLREPPGQLNDFALASRLSYFLWSTMPDEKLLTLAREGKLREPAVLREQVERLLSDRKSAELVENFTDQWLNLRDIDFTEPDRRLYPEYDSLLRVAMVDETRAFFAEVLKDDLPLTNFVASDFSMLNARLAEHYGIEGVEGFAMKKVALPPESHRGGLMTMASVLKVTANGTTTSPVVRGAWVLDRLLGTPPAPPPGNVPAVEPDIRGATTIREQLAKHREVETCNSCHRQIDPPGFALESFDVIGGWRENYRTVNRGEPVMIDGKRMPYLKGPRVDAADELSDGRKFANIDEFKQRLLENPDQLARALATKLLTYGTGHPPETLDRAAVNALVDKSRQQKFGLRSLVHEIVQSEMFRSK